MVIIVPRQAVLLMTFLGSFLFFGRFCSFVIVNVKKERKGLNKKGCQGGTLLEYVFGVDVAGYRTTSMTPVCSVLPLKPLPEKMKK